MNPEIKERWIAALRSGKYAQKKHKLRGYEGFCCLGVLVDIEDPDGWIEISPNLYKYKNLFSTLPQEMLDSCGIDLRTQEVLIKMNDKGASFEKIASWIQDNL
tara:strand:+ start:161 stop:469 length:309 start_codon:yes stop_codon:yes gene_type:complete